MVFLCERCHGVFKTANYLRKHLTNSIPCDLVCNSCGKRFDNRMQYSRHLDYKCEPIEYTKKQIESMEKVNNIISTASRFDHNAKTLGSLSDVETLDKYRIIDTTNSNTNNQQVIHDNENYRQSVANNAKQTNSEFIYLIWKREFRRLNEPTYKIGRTGRTMMERLKEYDNNTETIYTRPVNDSTLIESKLKALFKEKYIQKLEYGNEYFYGDFRQMTNDIDVVIRCLE